MRQLPFADHRANLGPVLQRVTNLQHTGPRDQLFNERIMHRGVLDQAIGGGAFLARATKGLAGGMGNSQIKIRVIHNDQ